MISKIPFEIVFCIQHLAQFFTQAELDSLKSGESYLYSMTGISFCHEGYSQFAINYEAEKGGYTKSVFGKKHNDPPIITFIPICRKCLTIQGDLDECPNCAHEPALTKGRRYYCPRCVKKHKNPRDCSDCTTV